MTATMVGIPEKLAREIRAHQFVCGSDEVGYGCWAGPLVVCAVVTPSDWKLAGVTDSKALTPAAREQLYPKLIELVTHCLVQIDVPEIDRLGVGNCLMFAHRKAIEGAWAKHEALGHSRRPITIIDGSRGFQGVETLPKADTLIPAVSAASILAKVYRDQLMRRLAKEYPGYGFETNVGYGTADHRAGLRDRGVTPIHRTSYEPIQEALRQTPGEPDDFFGMIEDIGAADA